MGVGRLNPKQARFVEEYLKDLNATRAAKDAGYSARRASELGYQLLQHPTVAAAIQEAKQVRSERTQITADRVLEEIAAIAFAHMGQFATWHDDRVSLIDSSEVDPRAVSEVSQRATRNGNNVGIKLHDKLGALAKLGDHLGMWKKDPQQSDDADGLDVTINRGAT